MPTSVPVTIDEDVARATDYALAEKAPSTRKAYWKDFELFGLWCQDRGATVLPATPETVAAYLAFEAARGTKPSTIGRRCAAIRYVHGLRAHPKSAQNHRLLSTLSCPMVAFGYGELNDAYCLGSSLSRALRWLRDYGNGSVPSAN